MNHATTLRLVSVANTSHNSQDDMDVALYLLNTGEPVGVEVRLPCERAIDIPTGQIIAQDEERIDARLTSGEAFRIAPTHDRQWAAAMSECATDDPASGIRHVYGWELDGLLTVSLRIFFIDDPYGIARDQTNRTVLESGAVISGQVGIPRRYRVRLDADVAEPLAPMFDGVGMIRTPLKPTLADIGDLIYHWRWEGVPVDEIARYADLDPDDLRTMIAGTVLRQALVRSRLGRHALLEMFTLLEARRQHQPIDLAAAVVATGVAGKALQRCLDLVHNLDLGMIVGGRFVTESRPLE